MIDQDPGEKGAVNAALTDILSIGGEYLMKAVLAILLLFMFEVSWSQESVLRCDFGNDFIRHVSFNLETKKARLIVPQRVRDGPVEETNTHMSVPLLGSERDYEGRLLINRYSGDALLEWGGLSFEQGAEENIVLRGICGLVPTKQKV